MERIKVMMASIKNYLSNGVFSKKFCLGVAGLTALIICVCAVCFEPRINISLRRMIGLRTPTLSFVVQGIEKVPEAEKELAKVFEKHKVEYALGINDLAKVSDEKLADLKKQNAELVYVAPHYSKEMAEMTSPFEYEWVLNEAKKAFTEKGFDAKYVLYPSSGKARKGMIPYVQKDYEGGLVVRYVSKKSKRPPVNQLVNNKRSDRYKLSAVGFGRYAPVSSKDLKEAVEIVRDSRDWGIVVLAVDGKYATPEALQKIDKMLHYAKKNYVDIVPLREGLRRFVRE